MKLAGSIKLFGSKKIYQKNKIKSKEFIFVDDGSNDNSSRMIITLLKIINLKVQN